MGIAQVIALKVAKTHCRGVRLALGSLDFRSPLRVVFATTCLTGISFVPTQLSDRKVLLRRGMEVNGALQ